MLKELVHLGYFQCSIFNQLPISMKINQQMVTHLIGLFTTGLGTLVTHFPSKHTPQICCFENGYVITPVKQFECSSA